MKAYKIPKNYHNTRLAGRIILQIDDRQILAATPSLPQILYYNTGDYFTRQYPGLLVEVELEKERWVHPHLPKFVKNILEIQK